MASTPVSSQALTKRQAEQQLMPPPPPPKRIKRPSTVLDEDIYTNALSEIIARDFFPGLLESQIKQEYLEALESKDQAWIASSRKKLAEFVDGAGDGERKTPSRTRATSRFTGGDETPTGWGGDTPMSVVSTSTAGTATPSSSSGTTTTQPKEIPDVSKMGLMAFQTKYTSEDNESFNKLMDRQNAKHREKYAWVWSGNKIPTARQIAHHTREAKRITAQGAKPADNADEKKALVKSDLDSRPAKPDAWDAKPENSLMFLPSSIEDTHETIQQKVEAASRAGPKRVLYQNTRLGTSSSEDGSQQQQQQQPPPPPSPAISAIQDAIAGRPRLSGSETSAGSYAGGETPRVNGYAFVDEDELEPEPSSSFGQNGDDDAHLLGSADKTPNPFQIPQNRKREDLHHRMVDRMARTKRAEKANVQTKTPVIPRFASSPRVDFGRTPSSVATPGAARKTLTPAAQKLLNRVGNSTPRGSSGESSSQSRNMWTPTPKRK